MKILLAVFIGGGIGSACRFGVSKLVMSLSASHFPWGTLAANVLACAILGITFLVGGKDIERQSGWFALLAIGFCGGFSTFSTFSIETLRLMREGMLLWAAGNIVLSVAMCLLVLHFLVRYE